MGDVLAQLSVAELRARRDEARAAEQRLSYARRLLHAQMDIVGAGADILGDDDLTASLATALSDGADTAGRAVRAIDLDVDPDVDVAPLPDLRGASSEDRAALLTELRAREAELSSERARVLADLDALQDALVARYRTDGIDVAELLGGEAS